MTKEPKKHINNLVIFIIGVVLVVPFYLYDNPLLALLSIVGYIFVLSSIISAIINKVKSRK